MICWPSDPKYLPIGCLCSIAAFDPFTVFTYIYTNYSLSFGSGLTHLSLNFSSFHSACYVAVHDDNFVAEQSLCRPRL